MSKLPTLLVPGRIEASGVEPGETPLAYIQRWLRRRMPENGWRGGAIADRVLVVRAKTGSGKSTVLPVGVFRILRSEKTPARVRYRGPGVICTQPRVLTAIELAKGISSARNIGGALVRLNPDMILGETCGFQTGPLSNKAPTGLVFATAGVLAAQLRNQEDEDIMGLYRFILVDEAHERSLDADMTLMLLKNFYRRNEGNARLPFLLLTSATFDTESYAAYFGLGAANIIEVTGRSYEIREHWPEKGTNNFAVEAAKVAIRIHEENAEDPPEKADILVFMPGNAESQTVVQALKKGARAAERRPYLVLMINREVIISQTGDYPLVFERPGRLPHVDGVRPARRIIVSTVVAETGLTIDTLRYVIDCGWNRTMEVYHPWDARGLITRPAPRSRIRQRMGRAGRLFDGDFYPLYTKNVYGALEDQQLPDIVASGPSDIFLAMVREQQRQKLRLGEKPEFRVEDIALLDPPPLEAYLAASSVAAALGFISPWAPLPASWPPDSSSPPGEKGYGLTPLGFIAASFARTSMEGVRIILAGYSWGAAASDLATAVAMFGSSVASLRTPPPPGPPPALPFGAAALRASLPAFLNNRVGGAAERVLPPTEEETFYFRAKLFLADDFAEAVLLFDAFARQLGSLRGDLRTLDAWCEGVGVSFQAMMELARRRESVIEEMLMAGLNPFRHADRKLSDSSVETLTDRLKRFKRCLYDGLRCRLLRFDPAHPDGPGYVSKQGLRVRTPELLTDAAAGRLKALRVTRPASAHAWRPRWIVTDQIRLMPAPARPEDKGPPLFYVATAGQVSILDGYVSPDLTFDEPREPAAAAQPRAEAKEGEAALEPAAVIGAYERAAAAALAVGGVPRAPVCHLSTEQLEAIYGPRQLELLIREPLMREGPQCCGELDEAQLAAWA